MPICKTRLASGSRFQPRWPKAATVQPTAIGKGLIPYDCFDTGVFAVGPALFTALGRLQSPSLTEGMRALAAEGTALTVDCGELAWIDVDDGIGLKRAERWAASRLQAPRGRVAVIRES